MSYEPCWHIYCFIDSIKHKNLTISLNKYIYSPKKPDYQWSFSYLTGLTGFFGYLLLGFPNESQEMQSPSAKLNE